MRTVGKRVEQRRRGRLHHLEKGGASYFLTFHAQPGERFTAEERGIIFESCKFGHPQRWILHGVVVMPDHVHLLLTPQVIKWIAPEVRRTPRGKAESCTNGGAADLSREPRWMSLAEIVKSIKSVTARRINQLRGRKSGSIGQDDYYDREVRDEADFAVKLKYLLNNPVKQGLVKEPAGWDALWVHEENRFRG